MKFFMRRDEYDECYDYETLAYCGVFMMHVCDSCYDFGEMMIVIENHPE